MRRIITAIIIILASAAICTGQGKDRRKSFKTWENYEVTTEKVGVEGTKFIKVWGFGKTPDKALMNAKRNAVHACIFRGLPAKDNVNANCAPLRIPGNNIGKTTLKNVLILLAPKSLAASSKFGFIVSITLLTLTIT